MGVVEGIKFSKNLLEKSEAFIGMKEVGDEGDRMEGIGGVERGIRRFLGKDMDQKKKV